MESDPNFSAPIRRQRRRSSLYAITKTIGAFTAVLGGLDALVFTAGIGENSAPQRAAVCSRLAWQGVKLGEPANASGGPRIATAESAVSVWVIRTDEEWMLAQHTLGLLDLGKRD